MEEAKVESPTEILSPSSNGRSRRRRRSNGSSSFEFCVLRKPNLVSADQLISDGVLLPLHLLKRPFAGDESPEPKRPNSSCMVESLEPSQLDSARVEQPQLGTESGPEISAAAGGGYSSAAAAPTSSKRWRDIFKKSDKKGEKVNKDKKGGIFGANNGMSSAAERVLNINIWPFRRTKSAGNGGPRPGGSGSGSGSPKVSSSAPSSVTNSPGELKSKKSPSCPKGRSNLVWPARRSVGAGGRSYGFTTKPAADKSPRKDRKSFRMDGNKGWRKVSPAAADGGGGGGDWHKARILTMNDSMCTDTSAAAGGGGGVSGERPGRVNLRNLFNKKVY